MLSNRSVGVFRLELPPHFHADSYQNTHDVIWIALSDGKISFADAENGNTAVSFRAGDARFFRSFHAQSLVNEGGTVFRGVIVELKARGLAAVCDCSDAASQRVCGCPGGAPLPELWAVGLGEITLSDSVLAPAQKFRHPVERDDMLLVAVTALDLQDEGDSFGPPPGEAIRLQPGGAAWLKSGLHRLQNLGNAPARFVTLEF